MKIDFKKLNLKKAVALTLPVAALAAIGIGLSSMYSAGAGAAVVGGLIWLDLSIESFKHGRIRKHDGRGE